MYRYGFNGMERDEELKGFGNSYTTHFRQYDPRIGRWLTRDPKSKLLPSYSDYNASLNNPILLNDPNGDIPPFIAAGLVGAAIGAAGELTGQALANLALGKSTFDGIDWGDVVIAGIEGGVIGGTFGAAAIPATALSSVAKVSVDITYNIEDGVNVDLIGQDKSSSKVLADGFTEVIGAVGGKVIGDIPVVKTAVEAIEQTTTPVITNISEEISDITAMHIEKQTFEEIVSLPLKQGGGVFAGNLDKKNRNRNSRKHTIQPNETLESISKKYRDPIQDILKRNNLKSTDEINVDQEIIVTQGGGA